MLSTYSFKRTTFLLGTMIFAGLAVAMMAQSVHAQSIAAVRGAVVSDGLGSKIFRIDSSGRMREGGDFILEITRLTQLTNSSGALVGKYYAAGKAAPASTNVTGTVNIVGDGQNVCRISFTVGSTVGSPLGSLTNETVFEGAIRLGGTRDPSFGFMAGTYTSTVRGGVADAVGPFPFCAMLSFVTPS